MKGIVPSVLLVIAERGLEEANSVGKREKIDLQERGEEGMIMSVDVFGDTPVSQSTDGDTFVQLLW